MVILQHILYPSDDRCSAPQMFYHFEGDKTQVFDGYFNVLSLKKWRTYTTIGHIFLRVRVRGKGEVHLCATNHSEQLFKVYVHQGCDNKNTSEYEKYKSLTVEEVNVEVTDFEGSDVIWFSWTPETEQDQLCEAYYYTQEAATARIKLALNICTYHRETYLKRNLDVLRRSILNNHSSSLWDKVEIFIVDNGRSLDCETVREPHEHLFYNINAGGSGGFARGIMEISKLADSKEFTHVIMLDDDVIIEPDAFVRIYAMLLFVKKDYQYSCIAGAMLDIEERYRQNEAGALYNRGNTKALHANLDLRDRDAVVTNEEITFADYAGWWFACYPVTVANNQNLPLPFFIHFDDMEYGLRNANGVIYLNGICVWHGGFGQRYSQVQRYYDVRNRLITNALRENITGKDEAHFIRSVIIYDTLRYQYETAQLLLLAVKDFTRGAEYFKQIEPQEKHKQLCKIAGHMIPIEQMSEDPDVQKEIERYVSRCVSGHTPQPTMKKNRYLYTLNGWILPADKKKEWCCYSLYRTDMRELYRKRNAALLDPVAKKGIWVKRSYKKAVTCVIDYVKICHLLRQYDKVSTSYRKAEKSLINASFWEKYLQLNEKE